MGESGYRFGPGDGIVRPFDTSPLDELRAKETEMVANLADDQVLVEYAEIKYGQWNPAKGPYNGPNLEMARDAAAATWRQLAWVRHTIKIREAEAEAARRRAVYAEQARNIEIALGLPPSPESLPPAEFRDEQFKAEQAARAALPKPTTEQLNLMDPQTPQGKARIKRETDLRDPAWRAKHGLANLEQTRNADGRGEPEPEMREAIVAKEERGGLLAGLQRMLGGKGA